MLLKRKTIILIIQGILCMALLYHFLVVLRVVDYSYTWGGKINGLQIMFLFESISIFITSAVLLVVSLEHKLKNAKWIRIFYYIMSILFALNTIGNFFAVQSLESLLATPLTAILSILFYKLTKTQ